MLASLELNWLKPEKDIALPIIVVSSTKEYSGACYCPWKCEELIDGRYYPRDRGIIEVSDQYGDIGNTLAHEWRHHWQYWHGIEGELPSWYNAPENYKDQVIGFFMNSFLERDALMYSLKKYPDIVSLEWEEWLYCAGWKS